MNKTSNLGKDPVSSLFFRYYIPSLTSILSVTIHQLVNGIILGQQVGKEGVAAIGLYAPILTLFIAFGLTLMIGGGILIAKNSGAQHYHKVQQIFQFTTTVALLFGGIVACSAPFITKPIAHFLAGNENEVIVKSTSEYIFWAFLWLPFFFLRMLWSHFLHTDNAPTIARNASLLAVLLNIILDVLLVIVFPFGVAGASIATGIAILIATLYLVGYIRKGKNNFSIEHFTFTLQLKEWRELISFGIPSFVSEISFSLGLLMINKSLIPYGALAVSAFGVINYLSFIFLRLFTAAMIAILPIISFNIGAQLPQRVVETLRFSLLFTFLLGIIVTATGLLFPQALVNVFSGNETEEFKRLASNAVMLYFILFIAAGPNYILSAYLQTLGKSALSITINLLKGVLFIGLFLLLLPGYLEMELNGIWLSRSFTEISTLLLIALYTLYKKQHYYSYEAIMEKNKTGKKE